MPNLKLAEAYVDLVINRSQFDASLAIAIQRLSELKLLATINLNLNRSQADASLLILQQHMKAVQVQANFVAKVDRTQADASLNLLQQHIRALQMQLGVMQAGGGKFSGGRGGNNGGPGFGTGLLQGLGLAGLGSNPAMAGGTLVGAGVRESVGAAMELQSIFIDLRRFTGESAEHMERFKRVLFEIATTQAGASVKDLTDIASAGAKAGISDKEGLPGLETFTRGMAKVRNAVTGVGTEKLTDNMIQMLNLFHKGTDYVESFGSMLAKMDQISTASADSILDVGRGMAGTFASLNLGIKDVMAFSSVMADAGLTNQRGAGAFEQVLRMLASQSEKMAGLIGVPIKKFQEIVRKDAMGALDLLLAKFNQINKVDPIKGQEFLVSLGLRGIRTAGALQQVATIMEKIKERTKIAEAEESGKMTLNASNQLNSEKSTGQVGLFKNAVTQFADSIGTQFLPAINKLAGMGTSVLKDVSKSMSGKHYVRLDDGSIAERTQENSFTGWGGMSMRPNATPTDAEQRQLDKAKRGTAVPAMAQGSMTPAEKAEKEKADAAQKAAEEGKKAALAEAAAESARTEAGNKLVDLAKTGFTNGLAWIRKQNEVVAVQQKEKADKELEAAQANTPKTFKSKHFKDEADFARDFIQGALSGDKDREKNDKKEHIKELRDNSKEIGANTKALVAFNKKVDAKNKVVLHKK